MKDFICLWDRERERAGGGGAEGEGQAARVMIGAKGEERERISVDYPQSMELDLGLEPITLRSWLQLKSRIGCLTDWVIQACLGFLTAPICILYLPK